MITSSNEANEARPDRQNNDIPACSKPTVYSLVYYGHRTYVLYFYIPSPLLIEHSSIFPVFVLCTILLYSLRYWVAVPSMLFLRLCIVHSPRHVCNNPVYTVPMNRAIPVITPPKHCTCTEPSIQFLCLYIVLVCNVCGTVKLRISIKPDAKYKPSDDVYSAHGHNYNYLHTLKWLYTSVSS